MLSDLPSLFGGNGVLVTAISGFIIVLTVAISIVALILDYRNDRRARDTVSIERRRLNEVNIKITPNVSFAMTPSIQNPDEDGGFMILKLPMQNIGDGPVDLLAMLVSSRLLTFNDWKRGIGARSRDVEWDDYQTSYWNEKELVGKIFAGASTTKDIIVSANNFTNFAAKEYGTMRRIDAIHEIKALRQARTINVMYRIFTVTRGYSLGEILRQLGGGPPDPSLNVTQELLQFQRLAQPDYHRWRMIQQALINLNRFAFRVAIFDLNNPAASQDPLGIITTPDAWRLFLLHHWEFVDDVQDVVPRRLHKAFIHQLPRDGLKKADAIALKLFPERRLPDTWDDGVLAKIKQAHEDCEKVLIEMVSAWKGLCQIIAACEADPLDALETKVPKHCPNETYPRLIHGNPEYKSRWLALMSEGYLISRPFFKSRIQIGRFRFGGRRRRLNEHDIPDDPRVLEPFVMRTYFFQDSLNTATLGTTSDIQPVAPDIV